MDKKSLCQTVWNKLQERPVLDLKYDISTAIYRKKDMSTPKAYQERHAHKQIDLLLFAAGMLSAVVAGFALAMVFTKKDG